MTRDFQNLVLRTTLCRVDIQQRQQLELLSSGLASQLPIPLYTLVQRQRLQLVFHLPALMHQLVTMQELLPPI